LAGGDLTVLLGPWSELGEQVAHRRDDRARAEWEAWAGIVPRERLVVELVSHLLGPREQGAGGLWRPGSTPHAARMAGLAAEGGWQCVLTNAVRYADREDAPTADVLDAARRLVPLDARHVERGNAE
ncbi:hypothetical protein, partial [Acinetobacter baumannii]|uniref:hypothetical protein n=1 Tax=Acinetobacter baumannii TaxID=470 RepID=UPI001898CF46